MILRQLRTRVRNGSFSSKATCQTLHGNLHVARAVLLGLLMGLAPIASADFSGYAVFGDSWVAVGNNVRIYDGLTGNNDVYGGVFAGADLVAPTGVVGGGMFVESGSSALGRILMGGDVYLGYDSNVTGDVDSGGSVDIGGNTVVTGHITAGGNVTLASGVTVGSVSSLGSPEPFVPVVLPALPVVSAGTVDVETTAGDLSRTLAPGAYRDLKLLSGSTLDLVSGDYTFNSFIADDALQLNMDLSAGDIRIRVVDDVIIGADLVTSVVNPLGAEAYAQTGASWSMGDGGNWFGTIYGPNNAVAIGSYFNLHGNIFAGSISIGDNSTVQGLPDSCLAVTPVPGAALLAGIGLATVALFRRRSGAR